MLGSADVDRDQPKRDLEASILTTESAFEPAALSIFSEEPSAELAVLEDAEISGLASSKSEEGEVLYELKETPNTADVPKQLIQSTGNQSFSAHTQNARRLTEEHNVVTQLQSPKWRRSSVLLAAQAGYALVLEQVQGLAARLVSPTSLL